VNHGGEENQNHPALGQMAPQSQPLSFESCSICGNLELDRSQKVNFGGNVVSCGEFDRIFLSESISEASDRCLDFRAQLFGKCCHSENAGDGCDLCGTGINGPRHVIQGDVHVEFDGDEISCTYLSDKISIIKPSSGQCIEMKNKHFNDCCSEKCSLCSDSNLDWEAIIFFSGEEMLCHELDKKKLVEAGISSDSPRCEMTQRVYSETCCNQAPEKPCNICKSTSGIQFNMNSNARVAYDGEVKTCLELYNSLHSRREQSSEHCVDAHGELFDQCCRAIVNQAIPDDSSSRTQPSPTMSPTILQPTSEFNSRYTGPLSSPASIRLVCIGLFRLLIAIGLILC